MQEQPLLPGIVATLALNLLLFLNFRWKLNTAIDRSMGWKITFKLYHISARLDLNCILVDYNQLGLSYPIDHQLLYSGSML
ncbi:hypothetical protein BGX38DRAFT_1222865 [Terfezia claveryi]|nr:hypothetical protein BGX38DRAFT_1222865 [Terfezia claveryi]